MRLKCWLTWIFVILIVLAEAGAQTPSGSSSSPSAPTTTSSPTLPPAATQSASPCAPVPTNAQAPPASTPSSPVSTVSQAGTTGQPGTTPAGASTPSANSGGSTPGPLVAVSVAATPPATSVTSSPAKSKGPSNVYILTVSLQKGNNNAADISAALSGNIPNVVSVTAVSDTKLLFVLDVSPLKDGDKPQDPTPSATLVTKAVRDLEANKVPLAVDYKYKQLPAGAGNAADVASKLSGVIPGVTNIISIGSGGLLFLLDETPDPRFPSKPRDIRGLKKEIDNIVDGLAIAEPNFYMLPFPLGTGKNCDIANALAKQIPGVLNILTIGSTRLAFEIDGRVDSADLRNRIGEYVNALLSG
jgi:hypothetical protein